MEKQILSEEFIRMQRLAGIEIQAQEPILEEILLEACIGIYYLKNDLLLESLDESIIGKLKDKIKKLNLKPTIGLAASMLKGLKNTLTDEGYQKIIKIVKDYDGPKNISQVTDYLIKNLDIPTQGKLDESIFDLFRNKKTGDPNILSKSILSTLAFIILFNLTSSSFLSQAQSSMDEVPPTIENPQEVASELDVSDSTIDILNQTSEKANIAIGGEDQSNSVSFEDDKVKIGYGTADYEITDQDNVAKQVGDNIVKKLNGGKFSSKSSIQIKGLISNTGANSDDPTGKDTSGLAQYRLGSGLDLVPLIVKYLTTKYPNQFPDAEALEKAFKIGGTNSLDDLGPEVPADSKEAKANQTTEFDLSDVEGEQDDKKPIDTPDSPLTYFRRPKDLMPDGNKYYTILGYFLPLITNDKQPSKEFMKILNMKEGDVINDNFVNKKIEELRTQYPASSPKAKEAKKAIQILSWAQKVKKNPKSIGEFIKNLDPKINIPWEKRVLLRPGEKGKAAFSGGSKTTQTPAPGSQAQDRLQGAGSTPNPNLGEVRLANIYENLLFEAQASEWKSLPDYNESTAKSNLGELVPLYVYIWDIGDNGAIKYVSGINDDGSQAKNVPYKLSWEKFTTKYPVLDKKTNDYLFNVKPSGDPKKQGEPSKSGSKSDNIPVKFDKETDKTKNTSETNRIITAINNNSSIKTALNRIDNVEEFKQLILILLLDKLPVYKDNRPALKTALSKIQARIQPRDQKGQFIKLQEEDASDVIRLEDLLDDSAATQLRNELKNINTEEEIIQIIVRAIIPYLNPNLKNSTQSLKQAIIRAQADFDKMSKSSGDIDLKELFVKALRESLSR